MQVSSNKKKRVLYREKLPAKDFIFRMATLLGLHRNCTAIFSASQQDYALPLNTLGMKHINCLAKVVQRRNMFRDYENKSMHSEN